MNKITSIEQLEQAIENDTAFIQVSKRFWVYYENVMMTPENCAFMLKARDPVFPLTIDGRSWEDLIEEMERDEARPEIHAFYRYATADDLEYAKQLSSAYRRSFVSWFVEKVA